MATYDGSISTLINIGDNPKTEGLIVPAVFAVYSTKMDFHNRERTPIREYPEYPRETTNDSS